MEGIIIRFENLFNEGLYRSSVPHIIHERLGFSLFSDDRHPAPDFDQKLFHNMEEENVRRFYDHVFGFSNYQQLAKWLPYEEIFDILAEFHVDAKIYHGNVIHG